MCVLKSEDEKVVFPRVIRKKDVKLNYIPKDESGFKFRDGEGRLESPNT